MASNAPPSYIEASGSGYSGPYTKEHEASGVVRTPGGGYVSGYGMQQPASHQMAVVTVVDRSVTQPPNYMWLAILTFWFFGLPLLMSAASTQEFKDGNVKSAREWGIKSRNMSIAGMFFTVVTVVSMLVIYYGEKSWWSDIIKESRE